MPGKGEGRAEGEEGEGRKVRTPAPSIPAYAPGINGLYGQCQ